MVYRKQVLVLLLAVPYAALTYVTVFIVRLKTINKWNSHTDYESRTVSRLRSMGSSFLATCTDLPYQLSLTSFITFDTVQANWSCISSCLWSALVYFEYCESIKEWFHLTLWCCLKSATDSMQRVQLPIGTYL